MIEKFKFKKGIVGFKFSQVYGNILEIYDDKVIITVEDNINELFEFNNGLENDLDGFKEVFEVC